ncbi:HlyD family type I secretion periplasmic adaptor subunit [Tropicimonas sp.]|uniref:HlyD family type I secretion periplasmic adaptor subunit n=1 Tax=Tropicimonas sp. TaxID=2067044 RepID=UPI003A8923AF
MSKNEQPAKERAMPAAKPATPPAAATARAAPPARPAAPASGPAPAKTGGDRYSARFPMTIGIIALVLLVGGFGAWSLLTHISGAIIAGGQLEVEQNRQVVQHLDGGIVGEVLVQEGDRVEAGQELIRLDPTDLLSELAIVESQLYEIMARTGRMVAERDGLDEITFDPELVEAATKSDEIAELLQGQETLFAARLTSMEKEKEQLARRGEQIASQVEGIDAQVAALSEQLALIDEELESQQALLDKGLAQAARVLSLQREKARLSGTVGELTASRAEAMGRTTELDIEILKLDTTRREEAITYLRDLQYNLLELMERRRGLREKVARLDIRAPVSGIVYGMTVNTPRSVVRPADPIAYIVPQDRPLVIAARVPTIHIDKVYVGQDAILRFSTFDSRTTPELMGRVSQVSADAFTDERTQQSYYRAEVELLDGEIDKLEGKEIIPGMPVEAYFRTNARTPMAYLIKPFTDYFNKAFREG